jgi:peptide/nickel transport system ATP-binding protein
MEQPVVQVENLSIAYETRAGDVHAVRDVSFELHRGETLGIVGESGCGKSTLAYGLVNYLGKNGKIVQGDILFQGESLVGRSEEELRKLRGDRIAMVYQDPMTSLNPVLRIGEQMTEVLTVHRGISEAEARRRCIEMLRRVYMPDPQKVLERYPHQISGGQQQRIIIAMAMLNHPALLIMDEPTTALDVTVEAAVLDLIADLRRDPSHGESDRTAHGESDRTAAELGTSFDTAILFISHNLGVIARVSDRVGVMYAGELVELASVEDIFAQPQHPYTQGLIRCLPRLAPRGYPSKLDSVLYPIRGRVPSPANLPPGCLFEPRCDYAREACRQERPVLRPITPNHWSRCLFSEEIDKETRRQGDKETRRQGDKETRRQGAGEHGSTGAWEHAPLHPGSPAPLLPFSPAPLLPLVRQAHHVVSLSQIGETILEIDNLKTYYRHPSGSPLSLIGLGKKEYVKAVDGVSFSLPRGKTLGIVGESGCGKSTLIKSIIGLESMSGGQAEFMGFDLNRRVDQRDLSLIRELQMVFQNPDSTMNPSYTVGQQIERPLRRFNVVPKEQIRDEAIRLLRAVKLGAYYYDRLPHQLSGGEKQRVGIARAFAGRPDLVLCDEPVSALDVSVQAAVLNLLLEIQQEFGTTMIFIAHDLSVVRFFSDYIAVMYLGKIMEFGAAEDIYAPPYHPYTESLLAAVPIPDPTVEQAPIRLVGDVPSPLNPPRGCPFHTRCPRRSLLPNPEVCAQETPPWREVARSGDRPQRAGSVGAFVPSSGRGDRPQRHRIFCHIPLEQLRELEPVIPDR